MRGARVQNDRLCTKELENPRTVQPKLLEAAEQGGSKMKHQSKVKGLELPGGSLVQLCDGKLKKLEPETYAQRQQHQWTHHWKTGALQNRDTSSFTFLFYPGNNSIG